MRGRIRADDGFFFLMALLLLTLPLRWVLACFLAAMVHELGHALAVLLCGGRITGVMLSFRGARMDAAPLPVGAELVCVLAGPAASLTLGLLLPTPFVNAGALFHPSICFHWNPNSAEL